MTRKTRSWKLGRLLRSRRRRRMLRARATRRDRTFDEALEEFDRDLVEEIRAPEIFLLEQDWTHREICDFLARLRAKCRAADKILCVNFRLTKKVYAGAVLLFYSELSRLQKIYPGVKWSCRPSRDLTVNQVFKHLGIFKMLGYDSSVVPSRPDVVTWRFTSATVVDGERSGALLELYGSLSRAEAKYMFRGVAEATTNVAHHAYLDERQDGLLPFEEQRWWMFCRESEDHLYVAVCDLGIGIPRSLPIKFGIELVNNVLSKLGGETADGKMIRAAIEIARTRTAQRGRGKGLGDLKRVVDEIGGARLYIFSNKGLVEYWGGTEKVRNFDNSIFGTLVVWVLPTTGGRLNANRYAAHQHRKRF